MYAVDCGYCTVALRHCMVAVYKCCLNTAFETLVKMYESHTILKQNLATALHETTYLYAVSYVNVL